MLPYVTREPLPSGMMTEREMDDLKSSVRDVDRSIASRRDLARPKHSTAARVVEALEIGAGAALTGFAAGRMGSANLGPVPIGLAASVAFYVAEAMDYVPGKIAPHLENVIGKGGLAGYLTLWGAGQGYLMKQNADNAAAGKPPAAAAAPAPPATMAGLPGMRLPQPRIPNVASSRANEAELQAIMQRRRAR